MIGINGRKIEVGHFPDGTQLIRYGITNSFCKISWWYENDAELFTLICLVGHLNAESINNIALELPYIPNARQDRVKNPDDVFTLKYFAQVINSLNFRYVKVVDPHSYVSEALIDRIIVERPTEYIIDAVRKISSDKLSIYFPDEGAMKRYSGVIGKPYTFGIKSRDWSTGEIKSVEVNGDKTLIENHDILIIDDICSRGGTFYHSAKALKNLGANKIYLYVTHLENTVHEGELLTSDLIEKIYTTGFIHCEPHDKIETFFKK